MAQAPSERIEVLIRHTAELARAGMTPATSSNFSVRLNDDQCLITVSGRDKSRLTAEDFMAVDGHGNALEAGRKSSAETLLHTQIYRLRPQANAVLHTHSLAQTLLSMHYAAQGRITFTGYELQKAFQGVNSHEGSIELPIVANAQDMSALCASTEPLFAKTAFWGYLIAGHGLYAWGRDIDEARRHLDAFEFLLTAEMAKLGMRA